MKQQILKRKKVARTIFNGIFSSIGKVMLVVVCVLSIASIEGCKKGDIGPAGPTGQTGQTGQSGQTGIDGADGSKIYSGAGVPTTTIGTIGDFYLNLTNSNFYGPKINSGWGSPINLRGVAGATGTAGSKILSGTGIPAANIGVAGDYYLDKTNDMFYGPKLSTGWGVALNIKGAKGDPGTANVLYSGWVFATNFNDSSMDGTLVSVGYVQAKGLTQQILNTCLVVVYLTFGGGNYALPYVSNAGGKVSSVNSFPLAGKILITRFTYDQVTPFVTLSTGLQYRYIIIPGGVLTATKVDLSNYDLVRKKFFIKD